MLHRRKSVFARTRDVAPVFAVVGIGIAGVFLAMNILVTAAPVVIDTGPSPTATPEHSFPGSPSVLPFVSASPLVTPVPAVAVPGVKPTIVNSAVSATDPNHAWAVYLGYPGFEEGTTPWADEINADILSDLQTRAEQWEQGPAANPQPSGKISTLYGSFTIDLMTPALASITLTWTDDSSTRPPAVGLETRNYDLSTGQLIAFNDLFTDPSSALTVVSAEALPMLQAKLGADYDSTLTVEGADSSPANWVNWALTKSGIRFIFAQYQVTSRADSLPDVVIDWDSLRTLMVQTGPVAKLAGF